MTASTSPDFRALCAELLEALENAIRVIYREDGTKHISTADPVIAKADVALAQPEPAKPTVMEIIELHDWMEDEWRANNDGEDLPIVDFAQAVLARWGRLAMEPAQPTNQEIEEWADAAPDVPNEALDPDLGWQRCFTSEEFCHTIRAALEHWDGAE